MTQLGFYFDARNCIGCRTCQIACKDRNDLAGTLFRTVKTYETGVYPNPRMYHYVSSCNHCANPACVGVCPTGAMYKDEETGVVLHNDEECIGCQSCANACPYEVPQYIEELKVVHKCDTCKSIRDAGGNPTCVDACIARVLHFGDLDELRATYGDDCVSELPCLPSAATTEPSVLIKAKDCMLEDEFVEALM